MTIQVEVTTTEVGTTEQVTTVVEVAAIGPELVQVATAGPQGPQGIQGPQGPQGEPGQGILPNGGDTGEILVKLSDDDQDAGWTDNYATSAQGALADSAIQPLDNVSELTNDANYIDASGAPVQSVDGQTGAVDLSGEYDALGSASSVQGNLDTHTSATTSVHGIADTSQLIVEGDSRLSDERVPTDGSVTSDKIASGGISPASVTGTAVITSDARLSDERTPVDGSVTNAKVSATANIAPSKIAGTAVIDSDVRLSEGSASSETVRSLGTGATQALPGNYDVAGQAPVQSVAGKTGVVTLDSDDVGLGNVPNLDTTDAVNKAHDQNTDTVLDQGGANEVSAATIAGHIADTDNPHEVTKAQVGLGDVDNVSAADLRDRSTHTGTQTLSTISDAGTMASQDADNIAITGGSIDASIAYDNTNSELTATLVQTAIDELDQKKLDVSALSASVKFFPTTAAGAVAGYGRLVTDSGDADYDDPAVNVTVGPFSGTDQLLGSLVSDAGVLEGNTTFINVTTIGNVRRTSGNQNDVADFYFEVYKRDSDGVETLIGTSSNTAEVASTSFQEFFADALISDTNFTATDRVVLKFYGNVRAGGGGETYEFQYGGTQPVRTLFPVPVTVVPNGKTATDIQVDASGFSGLLSGTDDNVQTALDTLDGVTKSDIGLSNVDNTSDLNKPISTATQTALNGKADETTTITAGTGLDGGGDLSANRTLALNAASIASLALADSALQSGDPATDVAYDNSVSGLTATTVQAAIDELAGLLQSALTTE